MDGQGEMTVKLHMDRTVYMCLEHKQGKHTGVLQETVCAIITKSGVL